MSIHGVDYVSIQIEDRLAALSRTPFEACIFRVDNQIRWKNDPKILSIGPYHYGKMDLKMMEEHKLRYLQLLLNRRNESVDRYVVAIRALEERARKCYAESIPLSSDEFVQMMLLDGCFIIELFRKNKILELRDVDDPIFQVAQNLHGLWCDLMLFENQLPFFILVKLFDMTEVPGPPDDLIDIALGFMGKTKSSRDILGIPSSIPPIDNVKHLLHLVHVTFCSTFADIVSQRQCGERANWEFINSAEELEGAGVKFKKAMGSSTVLDIKFKNGVMEIPSLTIDDATEAMFTSLIAYEQYLPETHPKYVSDYILLMNWLGESTGSVRLLCRHGILVNLFGDVYAVCEMLSKLRNNVHPSFRDFSYSELCQQVSTHSRRRRNKWMGNLRQNFTHNPATSICFIVAILTFVFTFLQVIFAVAFR